MKATLKAWTTSRWQSPSQIESLVREGKAQEALGQLMYTNSDMSDHEDWTEIGVAEVSVTFHPREEIVAKELEGLQAQLEKVRADNHMRENAILERISNLQALTYEGGDQ
jgi:hypothetical protein